MTATNSEVLFVSWIANLPEGHSRTGNRVANATIIELLNSGGLSLLFAGTGRGLRRFPWRSKAFVVGGSGGRCCDRSGKLRFGGLVDSVARGRASSLATFSICARKIRVIRGY